MSTVVNDDRSAYGAGETNPIRNGIFYPDTTEANAFSESFGSPFFCFWVIAYGMNTVFSVEERRVAPEVAAVFEIF